MPDVFEDSDTFDEWFNLSDSQGSGADRIH